MKKKLLLWGMGLYFLLAAIVGIAGGPKEDEDKPEQQEEIPPTTETITSTPPPIDLTKDEIIANSIKETLGNDYYYGHYELDDILYVQSYTTSTTDYQRMIEDHYDYSLRTIEYLYDNLPLDNYLSIFITYYANLVEDDGKETEVDLISIEYVPKEIKEINFRQASYKNVPDISEYIYLHPILR